MVDGKPPTKIFLVRPGPGEACALPDCLLS